MPAQVLEKSFAALSNKASSSTPREDNSAIALFVSKDAVTGAVNACASCTPAPVSIVPVFIMLPNAFCAGEVILSIKFKITLNLKIESNPIVFLVLPYPNLHYVFPNPLHIPCFCTVLQEGIHINCCHIKIF